MNYRLEDNYQLFVNYICSDLKSYIPIYWKLFTDEVVKHTNYKLENLELQSSGDHFYFYHNDGNIDNFFQFICIVNSRNCLSTPQEKFNYWNDPNNFDLPVLYDGELTKIDKLKHLYDVDYVRSYIDQYTRIN